MSYFRVDILQCRDQNGLGLHHDNCTFKDFVQCRFHAENFA